jgi:hypothetical protein
MRAVLRDMILVPDLRTLPGDAASFAFGLQLLVGPLFPRTPRSA